MPRAPKARAWVYVIRLRRPLCHARHYVGWTVDLVHRVRQHLTGQGSNLLNAANAYGIRWDVVQVIPCRSRKEARAIEQHIKREAKLTRWDPIERRAAGSPVVSCRPGRTKDTRRTVEEALASVPPAVRALTASPERVEPRTVPFARRAFDAVRAEALATAEAPPAPWSVAEPRPAYRLAAQGGEGRGTRRRARAAVFVRKEREAADAPASAMERDAAGGRGGRTQPGGLLLSTP